MLTSRYMVSAKNLPKIMQKIVDGAAPGKFTVEHLKGLGFTSSNDLGVIALLKELGFLSQEGVPVQRYHDYRDKTRSRKVLGEALRQAYGDLFTVKERPTDADREAIVGKFKSALKSNDLAAGRQATTFLALLKLADLPAKTGGAQLAGDKHKEPAEPEADARKDQVPPGGVSTEAFAGLRYNIEIHLPATKEVEVYNSIFKSLKEHLLER